MKIARRKIPISLVLILLLAVAIPLLGACNTMAVASNDITNGGDASERSTEKHAS